MSTIHVEEGYKEIIPMGFTDGVSVSSDHVEIKLINLSYCSRVSGGEVEPEEVACPLGFDG